MADLSQFRAWVIRASSPRKSNTLCPLAALSWSRPNIRSRVSREVHARFWEHAEVRFLRVTRQTRKWPGFTQSAFSSETSRPVDEASATTPFSALVSSLLYSGSCLRRQWGLRRTKVLTSRIKQRQARGLTRTQIGQRSRRPHRKKAPTRSKAPSKVVRAITRLNQAFWRRGQTMRYRFKPKRSCIMPPMPIRRAGTKH